MRISTGIEMGMRTGAGAGERTRIRIEMSVEGKESL